MRRKSYGLGVRYSTFEEALLQSFYTISVTGATTSKLFFADVGNACFSQEDSGPRSGKTDAEAIAVIIADMPVKLFPIYHHYRDFRVRIDQGFEVSGFGSSRLFRVHKFLDPGRPAEPFRRMFSSEMIPSGKSHKSPPLNELHRLRCSLACGNRPGAVGNPFAPRAGVKTRHTQTSVSDCY